MELVTLMNQAQNLVCVKKKKRVGFRLSTNEWLCQVVVDDVWASAYFKAPPSGVPQVLYDSIEDATIAVLKLALSNWDQKQQKLLEEMNNKA